MLKHSARCIAFCIAASIAHAAEFRTGQAAQAVVGQSSFTSHEPGIVAQSLVFSNGKLFVADASGRVLTFDHIPGPGEDLGDRSFSLCAVCGFTPSAVANQAVSPTAANYSAFGHAVAVADTVNHRVLLWRDTRAATAANGPDVVLEADSEGSPIDNSTLIDPVSVALDGKRLFVGDRALRRILVWNTLPAKGDQGADAILGQSGFTAVDTTDTGPDHFHDPQALVSDGTNLFVADRGNRRILVFSPSDLPLREDAIINSASFKTGPLAPGTLITIKGQNLSQSSEAAIDDGEHNLPTRLAGVEVLLDGRKLPLISVSSSQIQAQLPYSLNGTGSSLYIRAKLSDSTVTWTNAAAVQLVPASPGLFALSGPEPRAGMLLHADTEAGAAGAPVTTDDPAKPGEVLRVWATGLGVVTASDFGKTAEAGQPYSASVSQTQIPVEAYVNGQGVPVLYAGLTQGAIGIYEVRVLLPADLPSAYKASLLISQGGTSSNAVTFPVGSSIH
jgi:uncharacterized protein (TIGR03437 family)